MLIKLFKKAKEIIGKGFIFDQINGVNGMGQSDGQEAQNQEKNGGEEVTKLMQKKDLLTPPNGTDHLTLETPENGAQIIEAQNTTRDDLKKVDKTLMKGNLATEDTVAMPWAQFKSIVDRGEWTEDTPTGILREYKDESGNYRAALFADTDLVSDYPAYDELFSWKSLRKVKRNDFEVLGKKLGLDEESTEALRGAFENLNRLMTVEVWKLDMESKDRFKIINQVRKIRDELRDLMVVIETGKPSFALLDKLEKLEWDLHVLEMSLQSGAAKQSIIESLQVLRMSIPKAFRSKFDSMIIRKEKDQEWKEVPIQNLSEAIDQYYKFLGEDFEQFSPKMGEFAVSLDDILNKIESGELKAEDKLVVMDFYESLSSIKNALAVFEYRFKNNQVSAADYMALEKNFKEAQILAQIETMLTGEGMLNDAQKNMLRKFQNAFEQSFSNLRDKTFAARQGFIPKWEPNYS